MIEVIDHVASAYGTQLSLGDLQQLIEIALLPYGRYPDIQTILYEGFTIVLPKEAVIERAVEVSINEKGKHWILAGVTFFVGENRQEPVSVFIPPITVYVI